MKKILMCTAAVLLTGATVLCSGFRSLSAERIQNENDRDALRKAVISFSYRRLAEDRDCRFDTWAITDIYPVYDRNDAQTEQITSYVCYLLKDGKTSAQIVFSTTDVFLTQYGSFPLIDDALRAGEPIAFAEDRDGSYLITANSVRLFGQYYLGNISETPLEGKDFSVYADRLSEPRFLRFVEYQNNQECLTLYRFGWNEIGGDRYYVRNDGSLAVSALTVDGVRYQFDESGVCQGEYTGFTRSDKGRRYRKDGVPVKNKWLRVGGERKYYADADGYFVTGTREIGGTEYSFGEDGALLPAA